MRYIDSDFKLHTENADGFREVDPNILRDKCTEYVEGFRFVPTGETWTRSDGVVFHGQMLTPWKDYETLQAIQKAYEANAERDDLLEYIENEEIATDELGNRYHKEVGTDGEIHLVLIESYTGELFQ